MLCSQGERWGRLALTLIFFCLIMSVNATLDTYLEPLGPLSLFSRAGRPLFYGGLYLLVRKKLPEEKPRLSARLWQMVLVLAAMPLCALIAVVLLTAHRYESQMVNRVGLQQGLVILPFALLTSLMLLAAILVLAEQERLERAGRLAQLREVYYQGLRQREGQVRRLRHDLRSHLTVLAGLLEQGQTQAARAYLRELGESPALKGGARLCENETANVVLSAKAGEMERAGIRLDLAVSLPRDLPVADTDLAALLGNALDNALEGVGQGEGRRVTVRCRADKGLFMLRVENTLGGPVRPDLATTKADREAHGLGLPGMGEIARRYHGTLEAGVREGRFQLVVCLLLGGPQP